MESFESLIAATESLITGAASYSQRFVKLPDYHIRLATVRRFDLHSFVNRLRPRLDEGLILKALKQAIDFKLQLFVLLIVDWDLYDREVLALTPRDTSIPQPLGQPEYQRALAYSLDQASIGKVRIAIERLMNLVYLIEKKQDLEVRKSKKSKFAKLIAEHPTLSSLGPLMAKVQEFDDRLRTPEFHKGSLLRRTLLDPGSSPTNDVMPRFIDMLNDIISVVVPIYFDDARAAGR